MDTAYIVDLDVVALCCLHRAAIWHERGLDLEFGRRLGSGDDAGGDENGQKGEQVHGEKQDIKDCGACRVQAVTRHAARIQHGLAPITYYYYATCNFKFRASRTPTLSIKNPHVPYMYRTCTDPFRWSTF